MKNKIFNILNYYKIKYIYLSTTAIQSTIIISAMLMFSLLFNNEADCMENDEENRLLAKVRMDPSDVNIQALLEATATLNQTLGENPENVSQIHNGQIHNAGNPPANYDHWGWRDYATAAVIGTTVMVTIYLAWRYWDDIRHALFGGVENTVTTVTPTRQTLTRLVSGCAYATFNSNSNQSRI